MKIKHFWLALILTCLINCDGMWFIPSDAYYYESYNSKGKKVVDGWFRIEEDSTGTVTGEWHFDKVGNPKDIGPQVGDGELVGAHQGDTLWIELHPNVMDSNISLKGIVKGDSYKGTWVWCSLPGLTGQGTFKAEYKD